VQYSIDACMKLSLQALAIQTAIKAILYRRGMPWTKKHQGIPNSNTEQAKVVKGGNK